jgi:hypothetical protein
MFDDPPPVMRGDLFALLDPDAASGTRRATTPEAIAKAAKKLAQRVELGERAAGTPVVMQCLEELVLISNQADPMRAFSTLSSIRQRLKSLGLARSRGLPGRLKSERVLVLPQSRQATVCRVLPAADHSVWYVATREAFPAYRWRDQDEVFDALTRPELADSAMGPPRVELTEVTFRLYRFGESSSDIRLCMRVVQEPGAFSDIHAAGDGNRVAMLSKDVIGVFEADGKPILSGRLPIGSPSAALAGKSTAPPSDGDDAGQTSDKGLGDTEEDGPPRAAKSSKRMPERGAEVTAMALDGDVLGLNLKSHPERPAELALIAISERRGFPVGVVGDDAQALLLGPRQAYIVDGVQLVRMPLFSSPETDAITLFSYRPWFAEYAWTGRHLMAWDGKRLWLSNGSKLIVLSDQLDHVLAEIVLPEPIIDFTVTGNEVRLVHHDARAGRLTIATWELG